MLCFAFAKLRAMQHNGSKAVEKLEALGNWIGAQGGKSLLLLDLKNERVIAGSPELLLAVGPTPVSSDAVLHSAALALIRKGVNGALSSPLAIDCLSAGPIWHFEVLVPGELGLLIQRTPFPGDVGPPVIAADALTSLLPRHSLAPLLEQRLVHFRATGTAFAILFLDFDYFKQINDRHGHLAGDEVLRSAAVGIQHAIRPDDRAIRFGGDEFVILIGGLHSQDEAVAIARRVREASSKPILWRGETLAFSASIGIAFVRKEDSSGEMILERADRAMYRAKNLGRCGKIELD
jgi:diguanylate cyclase (GGDEF)-like protein